MIIVDVERAIEKDLEVYLKGEVFEGISENNIVAKATREVIPLAMSRVTKAIIEDIGHLGYIDYMSKITLYA